jgi:hypothetical protein
MKIQTKYGAVECNDGDSPQFFFKGYRFSARLSFDRTEWIVKMHDQKQTGPRPHALGTGKSLELHTAVEEAMDQWLDHITKLRDTLNETIARLTWVD